MLIDLDVTVLFEFIKPLLFQLVARGWHQARPRVPLIPSIS
jgi:hypothetical protein